MRSTALIVLIILPFAIKAQIRNRWGWHLGIAQFPAWESGYLFDAQPPHGDFGFHAGPDFLVPIDRKRYIVFSADLAFHFFHFHPYDDPIGNFRNAMINANVTFNEDFEVTINKIHYPLRFIFGFGLTNSGYFGNTVSGSYYKTSVGTSFPVGPEILIGSGYLIKHNQQLVHLNLAYHFNPIKMYSFRIQYPTGHQFVHFNNYQYLLVSATIFPKIVIRKKKQKWSLCR